MPCGVLIARLAFSPSLSEGARLIGWGLWDPDLDRSRPTAPRITFPSPCRPTLVEFRTTQDPVVISLSRHLLPPPPPSSSPSLLPMFYFRMTPHGLRNSGCNYSFPRCLVLMIRDFDTRRMKVFRCFVRCGGWRMGVSDKGDRGRLGI